MAGLADLFRNKLDHVRYRITCSRFRPADTLLDIGCGKRPQTIIRVRNVHYAMDPMVCEPQPGDKPPLVRMKGDWKDALRFAKEHPVDCVTLMDVIEHLPKEEGAEILAETEEIVPGSSSSPPSGCCRRKTGNGTRTGAAGSLKISRRTGPSTRFRRSTGAISGVRCSTSPAAPSLPYSNDRKGCLFLGSRKFFLRFLLPFVDFSREMLLESRGVTISDEPRALAARNLRFQTSHPFGIRWLEDSVFENIRVLNAPDLMIRRILKPAFRRYLEA